MQRRLSHFLLAVALALGTVRAGFHDCPIKMEPLGCYADKVSDRAMSHEVMNGKDVKSPNYAGKLVTWNNYKPYLDEFICSCAQKAYDLGYKVIGIQFYAECWASTRGHNDFDRHGMLTSCVNGNYESCEKQDTTCAGQHQTNFIYRIAPAYCDIYFEPHGCYADKGNTPRPFPTYAMNERDYNIPNWNGRLIEWKQWNTYSPGMICRCAAEAKRRLHDYFAIQFYGECWTGCSNSTTYYRDGATPKCVGQNFDPPNINAYQAVGKDHANYVYKLKMPPIGKI